MKHQLFKFNKTKKNTNCKQKNSFSVPTLLFKKTENLQRAPTTD